MACAEVIVLGPDGQQKTLLASISTASAITRIYRDVVEGLGYTLSPMGSNSGLTNLWGLPPGYHAAAHALAGEEAVDEDDAAGTSAQA
eukprot:CAMPEP_0202887486 /NCGR_PEP_ID=MMETSP1391-20130828/42707_1 /ASSEMBLY_ACC=CAM_ASM_000867 /TAXON_ID=1034604 /ORGANISM="Chlamydomonas leiostraca, Strain SAG 11-49" /LENGTH=87 /DNA_ID=CAMNT_0049570775 /DNA_START=30 /DNA_END=294 /DNA_ORIENTATION=-